MKKRETLKMKSRPVRIPKQKQERDGRYRGQDEVEMIIEKAQIIII